MHEEIIPFVYCFDSPNQNCYSSKKFVSGGGGSRRAVAQSLGGGRRTESGGQSVGQHDGGGPRPRLEELLPLGQCKVHGKRRVADTWQSELVHG